MPLYEWMTWKILGIWLLSESSNHLVDTTRQQWAFIWSDLSNGRAIIRVQNWMNTRERQKKVIIQIHRHDVDGNLDYDLSTLTTILHAIWQCDIAIIKSTCTRVAHFHKNLSVKATAVTKSELMPCSAKKKMRWRWIKRRRRKTIDCCDGQERKRRRRTENRIIS